MTRMTPDDLFLAAEWLQNNDGEDGESDACHRVASFLIAEATRRQSAAIVRAAAKARGISPTVLRRALKQRMSA